MPNGNIDIDDEEVILNRQNLTHNVNTSDSIQHSMNQYNNGIYNDSNNLSKEKSIILTVTCTSIGMFTGLLGPTFPFLAENLSTEVSSIVQLITVKAIGFFIGTCLSSYLYTWFNVCCLLGLSCLSISFGICSLAFITDLTAFYLTSLTLGIGLGLCYNGIDALYNRLWSRPSVSTIRWLHLLVAVGVTLSTLILLPSTMPNDSNILSLSTLTQSFRGRRAISDNTTFVFNSTSKIRKNITKPAVVSSDILAGTLYTKPNSDAEQLNEKSLCIQTYCCYDENNPNNTFTCQEQNKNQSNDCNTVLSSCRMLSTNICHINKINTWCRIMRICPNETILNCTIEFIDTAINVNRSSTIVTIKPNTTILSSTTVTTHITTVTSTTATTTIRIPITYRKKPPTADSDNDDLSQNFFYLKIRLFFQTITSIHLLYLFLTCSFFLLGICYSILAMRGEGINSPLVINLNPLSLLILKPHYVIHTSNTQASLLSDTSSFKFAILIILFYFILSGIESFCTYLTYSFGIHNNLSEYECLILQICYHFGRLIDILINYLWFLLDKYRKKQSNLISIKFLILLRLIVLFVICFSNLFQLKIYFLFFSIGFLLTSLSSLILYWIERDLYLNETLIRFILYTIIISEMIIPLILFYKIDYFIQFYLFIGLALLIILFLLILYISKNWQTNQFYHLLSTSMDMNEMESQPNTDNDKFKDTKLQ
ncbi:unnamed protein product [Adineta steineri]|uniref:Uncharacterized protein n=1 Tax=Adineta steineri TaxID=433720 RepID=A0A819D2M0_9BILA|nr:unnamed protein product [Adineta steineri]